MADEIQAAPAKVTADLVPGPVALFAIERAVEAIAARDQGAAASACERMRVAFAHSRLLSSTILEAFGLAWPIVAEALSGHPNEAERIAKEMQSALACLYVEALREMQSASIEAQKMCDVASSSRGGKWQTK
jgi:hypothetical protein